MTLTLKSRRAPRANSRPIAASPAQRRKYEIIDPRNGVGGRIAAAIGLLGAFAAAAQEALASAYATVAGGLMTGAESVEDRLAERSLNRRRAAAGRAKASATTRAVRKSR